MKNPKRYIIISFLFIITQNISCFPANALEDLLRKKTKEHLCRGLVGKRLNECISKHINLPATAPIDLSMPFMLNEENARIYCNKKVFKKTFKNVNCIDHMQGHLSTNISYYLAKECESIPKRTKAYKLCLRKALNKNPLNIDFSICELLREEFYLSLYEECLAKIDQDKIYGKSLFKLCKRSIKQPNNEKKCMQRVLEEKKTKLTLKDCTIPYLKGYRNIFSSCTTQIHQSLERPKTKVDTRSLQQCYVGPNGTIVCKDIEKKSPEMDSKDKKVITR